MIADLHCDLLDYLRVKPHAVADERSYIGANLSDLRSGEVRLQVLAIYAATEKGSTVHAHQQLLLYRQLLSDFAHRVAMLAAPENLQEGKHTDKIYLLTAIENASCLCEEDEPLAHAFANLEKHVSLAGRPLYIGFTHHSENRFGGGNATTVGLKQDGKEMLNFLHRKKIAIDLSHASDALAFDILNYLDAHGLEVAVLASHSNFRQVWNHPRNLPDELAGEIIRRKGLIGMNFLRAFLHPSDPNFLYQHLSYGMTLGAAHHLCFGADYFYEASHPDQSRKPFFFPEHKDASHYPEIAGKMRELYGNQIASDISIRNVQRFLEQFYF